MTLVDAASDLETTLKTLFVWFDFIFDLLTRIIEFVLDVLSFLSSQYSFVYRAYPVPTAVGTYVFVCIAQDNVRKVINVSVGTLALPKVAGASVRSFSSRALNAAATGTSDQRDTFGLGIHFLVASVALAGAVANFYLIQSPMSVVMASDANALELMGLDPSVLGAASIVAFEFVAGIVFIELLGYTKIFGFISSGEEAWSLARKVVIGLSALLIAVFSALEVGLAWYRNEIIEQSLALKAFIDSPSGIKTVESAFDASPLYIQMTLGGLVPWILAIAVISLERVVRFLPVLFFGVFSILLFLVWFPLIAFGTAFERFNSFLIALFDVAVLPPTRVAKFVESLWESSRGSR